MGQGIGNMFSCGSEGGNLGNMQSMLSSLGGGLSRDHELVKQVRQKAGVQDPE